MSGCHNPKDSKLCKHGKDLEYGCIKCYFGDLYDSDSTSGIIERIEKLEKSFESQSNFNKDQIHINLIANKKIDKLEKRLSSFEEIYKSINRTLETLRFIDQVDNKPHKCPVCDGSGLGDKYAEVLIDGVKMQDRHHSCNACDGKGILWG